MINSNVLYRSVAIDSALRTLPVKKQSGFVLIIALIVLGAMSLAAVSLVRTVDTSTLLARNISFQRDAIGRNDAGIEAALQKFRLGGTYYAVLGLKNDHQVDKPSENYSSIMLSSDGGGVPTILKSGSFTSTWSAPPISLGESTVGYYLIERLCSTNDTGQGALEVRCIMGGRVAKGGTQPADRPATNVPPLFRATVKITGPRNTVSYAQTQFTIAEN